ncbi:MAG: hypothetical protein J5781_01055 [Clostridia bacterium]|nr:hypothetical protein [Clostridia bacterium]
MKKFDLDQKLSKKATTIAVCAIVCFVLLGIIGAILGGVFYTKGQEAKITNYSTSQNASFRMRNDGTLVYIYEQPSVLDVCDVIAVSKNANMTVLRAETLPDGVSFTPDTKVDLAARPHVRLLVRVKNHINEKTTDYLLEVVSKTDYQPDKALPVLIGEQEDSALQNIE